MRQMNAGLGSGSDRRGGRPYSLYYQIEKVLSNRLLHETQEGQALPSEAELSAEFGVSRPTIRRALAALEREGLVRSARGRGRVATRPLQARSPRFVGWIDDVGRWTGDSHAKVIEKVATLPSTEVSARLGVPSGTSVFRIRRIRYVGDSPVAYIQAYLPLPVGAALSTRDLERSSLAKLLSTKYRLQIAEAQQTVTADLADAEVARQMKIAVGSPVLRVRRLFLTRLQAPVYYSIAFYPADRYEISATLRQGSDRRTWRSLASPRRAPRRTPGRAP